VRWRPTSRKPPPRTARLTADLPADPSILFQYAVDRIDLRLFCLAHAGGSAKVFSEWRRLLPGTVEICCVELPGHGARALEEPFDELGPLVEALERAVLPHLTVPFVFFGHSLGGLLGYELTHRLRERHGLAARRLLVASCPPPHVPPKLPDLHLLPDPEFRSEIHRLGGTPEEVVVDDELWRIVAPGIRADVRLANVHLGDERHGIVHCPMTVFGGTEDELASPAELREWQRYAGSTFNVHLLDGGHFVVHEQPDDFIPLLKEELAAATALPYSVSR
jgi:medium-chain acyl-[acyl-carrier-protein] hydrolase